MAGTGRSTCLKDLGYEVHLSNPHGNDWGKRRVKNDERDARDLADLLRLGRLAEAWIAPPATRELRELVRFRFKLSNLRTGIKAQAHAVMAKNGILPVRNDMWGESGSAQFDSLDLPDAFDHRLAVLRDLVHYYDEEIERLDRTIHSMCKDDPGYLAVQAIYGVGQGVRSGVRGRDRRRRTVSTHRRPFVRGPGSHPSTESPTARSTGDGSPSRARAWSGGRPSRRSPATTAARSSRSISRPSPHGEGEPRPMWPSPAKFSRSSTTACETARFAVSGTQGGVTLGHTGRELAIRQGSHLLLEVATPSNVIEPVRLWPERTMSSNSTKTCLGSRACPFLTLSWMRDLGATSRR